MDVARPQATAELFRGARPSWSARGGAHRLAACALLIGLALSLSLFGACAGGLDTETYTPVYRQLRNVRTYVHEDGRASLRAESLFDALDYEVRRLQQDGSTAQERAILVVLARARDGFACAVRGDRLPAADDERAFLLAARDVQLARRLQVDVDETPRGRIVDRALFVGRCKAVGDRAVFEFEYLLRTPS